MPEMKNIQFVYFGWVVEQGKNVRMFRGWINKFSLRYRLFEIPQDKSSSDLKINGRQEETKCREPAKLGLVTRSCCE